MGSDLIIDIFKLASLQACKRASPESQHACKLSSWQAGKLTSWQAGKADETHISF
jgi:hypothetical protein